MKPSPSPAATSGNNMDNFTDDASPKAGVPTGSVAVEWRVITTAPKDGTIFTAGYYIDGDDMWTQFDCFWGIKSHTCGEMGEYCDSDWHNKRYGYQTPAWRCAMFEERMKPTHWHPHMPPPTPALKVGTPAQAESPGDEVQKGKP